MSGLQQIRSMVRVLLAISTAVLGACTTHCGLFTYCDVPKSWPLKDTFTVESQNSALCVGSTRRSGCASRAMFRSGTRKVAFYTTSRDEEETNQELFAVIPLKGAGGTEFVVRCFQYNGKRVLGLTAVRVGIEVYDRGRVVATYPSHPVQRRTGLFVGCFSGL